MKLPRVHAFNILAIALAAIAVPATAVAADVQPGTGQTVPSATQSPFGGTIDVQQGSIDGRVNLDSGSATLRGALSDPGVEGQLQVTVPGQFAGSGAAANGVLSYSLMMCGAGVTFGVRGSSISDLHVTFHDTASDPTACTAAPSPPAPSTAQTPMTMQPVVFAAAQAQPASDDGQALLFNWLRRLFAYSLLAILLVLLIPAMPGALAVATQVPPWGRIGLGLALAVTLPLLGLLLFALGLPVGLWWLGALLLALYPVLLVLSLTVSGLALGSWTSRLVRVPGIPGWIPFAVGLIVISFASLLPYVGPFVNLAAVIFGLGTLVLAPRSQLSARHDTAPRGDVAGPDATTAPVPSAPIAA